MSDLNEQPIDIARTYLSAYGANKLMNDLYESDISQSYDILSECLQKVPEDKKKILLQWVQSSLESCRPDVCNTISIMINSIQ